MGRVSMLGDPQTHFWLTRSVARSLGVSLSEALAGGQLTAKEYATMVTQCRRCCASAACKDWLACQAQQASQAPEFCKHAEVFDRLLQQR
ncbi:hypothetical protein NBRC116594_08400 [Shimia sp. NS0008-38b]|uniref:DUF6455 family protein n=1 Tax=Shimia sp. NS0008-38b TaxID=3127653 RepID=UPI00310368F0